MDIRDTLPPKDASIYDYSAVEAHPGKWVEVAVPVTVAYSVGKYRGYNVAVRSKVVYMRKPAQQSKSGGKAA